MSYSKNYKSKEEKQKELETLIKTIDIKVQDYTVNTESLKEYLTFMSKFYNYSFNNCMLIDNQFPGAIAVGSYAFWKEKGFQVSKGEKGIKILVPTKLGDRFEDANGEIKLVSKASVNEKLLINSGDIKIIKGITCFKQGYVFDVSQTNAKASDLPKIFPNRWLEGAVQDYNTLNKGLLHIAKSMNFKIITPKYELGSSKGITYPLTKEIALNPRNSELQNIKTLLHELTHAKLHKLENLNKTSTAEKEFQAELTAFSVCSYFGIDTNEYSLNYLYNWTKDTKLNDKKILLKEVNDTSREFIELLENTLILSKENSKINDDLIKSTQNLTAKSLTHNEKKELWDEIRQHEKWLKTNGIEGKRLDFHNKDLSGMKFLKVDLRLANLRGSNLSNSIIYGDLRSADFTNTKIDGTKFIGCMLNNIKIEDYKLDIIENQLKENAEIHNSKMNKILPQIELSLER